VVVMRGDGTRFGHRHAETFDDQGRPVAAMPGTTFGPELALNVRWEVPGTYRLWAPFRLADGTVVPPRSPCTRLGTTAAHRPWTGPESTTRRVRERSGCRSMASTRPSCGAVGGGPGGSVAL
jgi:hypothetical protein